MYISTHLKDAVPMIEHLYEYLKLRKDEMK
jgi:hypothetical protein